MGKQSDFNFRTINKFKLSNFNFNMDAANVSGTYMISERRKSESFQPGSPSGTGQSGTSFGSFGSSSSNSGSFMNNYQMFKTKDANDTVSAGLSNVHKYMGSPF